MINIGGGTASGIYVKDQKNVQERSEEVKRMRSIYSSASKVIAWFGEADDDSDKAITFMRRTTEVMKSVRPRSKLADATPSELRQLGFDFSTESWTALFKFWQRPYWTRIWVLPELACSGNILNETESRCIIHCGHKTTPFHHFAITGHLHSILRVSNKFISPELTYEEPFQVVGAFASSAAAAELVHYLVREDHNLAILGGNRLNNNMFGPSWIPELYGMVGISRTWGMLYGIYSASADQNPDISFSLDNSLLFTRGIIFGSLLNVIGPFKRRPTDGIYTSAVELSKASGLNESIEALYEFSRKLSAVESETCWRTLVMDASLYNTHGPKIPAPDEFGHMWRVLNRKSSVPKNFHPELSESERIVLFRMPLDLNIVTSLSDRCLFSTSCGLMGIGPYNSQPTDVVAVLYGGDLCFVLRPKGDCFEFIGEAYVHGVMKGELFQGQEEPQSRIIMLC